MDNKRATISSEYMKKSRTTPSSEQHMPHPMLYPQSHEIQPLPTLLDVRHMSNSNVKSEGTSPTLRDSNHMIYSQGFPPVDGAIAFDLPKDSSFVDPNYVPRYYNANASRTSEPAWSPFNLRSRQMDQNGRRGQQRIVYNHSQAGNRGPPQTSQPQKGPLRPPSPIGSHQGQSSPAPQAGNQGSNPEKLSQNLQSRQQEAQRQYAMRLQQQQQLGNRAENNSIVYTSSTTTNNKRRRPVSDSLFRRPDDKSSTMTSKQSFNSAHNFFPENLKYTISEDHTRDNFKRRKAQFGALGQHNSRQAQQPKHIYNDPSPSDDMTSVDEDLSISSKEDSGRSAGSGGFQWVTGNKPDDFKAKHVMQTVRQTAMGSYLQGAKSQKSNKFRSKKEFKTHTQEDFERWKARMRGEDTPAGQKDESREH